MIRFSTFEKCESEVRASFQCFINEAKFRMLEISDLLVCQQGGHLDWNGKPYIGLGNVGLDNLQKVNIINHIGTTIIVDDIEYFEKHRDQMFTGLGDFEKAVFKICNMYLDIWENELFLRTFAELVKVANGEHYDWGLDLSKLNDTGKGNFIRKQIIDKLSGYPYIQEVVRKAYNSNLRNVVGHSQYHLVPGGLWFDNFGRTKYATSRGLAFEEWESTVAYAWVLFRVLFDSLYGFATSFFYKLTRETISGGIPIVVPDSKGNWISSCLYPYSGGTIWRFTT